MSESLTNLGSSKIDATESVNTTGVTDEILEWSPIDGIMLSVENRAKGGKGIPLYLQLRDSNDDPLPADTEVVLRWDSPSLDQPKAVSERLSNIRAYRTLSLKEQQSEEYSDQTRINLKGAELQVLDFESVEIAIESDVQVDWSNSRAELDREAVSIKARQ